MDFIFILKIFITIIFALILGLISSIPVGTIQLEVIKKSINGHVKPAIAIAAGSATSDLVYGVLTIFGIGNFLNHNDFKLMLYGIGATVISFLIFKTYRERSYIFQADKQITYRKRVSFASGLTLAATNPAMIMWWIFGYNLYLQLNIIDKPTFFVKSIFIISTCIGLGGYLTFVAIFLHKVKNSFSENFLKKTNLVFLVVLLFLLIYFIIQLTRLAVNISNPATLF